WGEVAPAVAAAPAIDARRAADPAADYEKNLAAKAAGADVFDECGQGVIERDAHAAEAFADRGVADAGAHVPNEVRRHGHEAGAALAQAAREQQQFAER